MEIMNISVLLREIKPNYYYYNLAFSTTLGPFNPKLTRSKDLHETTFTYLMACYKTGVIQILCTQTIIMHISQQMSVFIGSKLEAQPLQRWFLPLPEVSAVWSWRPNQTPLSARSSFLSGQWSNPYAIRSLSYNIGKMWLRYK